ncbi:MAG: DUF1501 domain-containing protein [Planctomycetota bacterium]|nr:DUF1501 domain-containing protein [Planctomycetota bacterium]
MPANRRQMIRSLAAGGLLLPGMLSELLGEQALGASDPLMPKKPHHRPRAKRVIFLYMTGGVSHIDSFDPKPELRRYHNEKVADPGYCKGADWKFSRYGECGLEVSELFPEIGSLADRIGLIRSMWTDNNDHFGASIAIHTGSSNFNRPSIGSWVSYGLGSESQNLPSFMVISPGLPYGGGQVWGSDFLPVVHQGTRLRPVAEPIPNMRPLASRSLQQTELDMLGYLNRQHLVGRETDPNLAARIRSFETAFGMQNAAPEVFDLSSETEETHALYGLEPGSRDSFAWQCLVARRLAERGVRFIELIDTDSNSGNNWDTHGKMARYNQLARNVDRPIAALVKDLDRRGMLEDTLVVWTTEFGRNPFAPNKGATGRGHHRHAFSTWMAGGGIRGGMVYGKTDQWGNHVVEDKVTVHDLHATILHQLGMDHTQLTYRHAGRDYRLTDVHGRVVRELIDS